MSELSDSERRQRQEILKRIIRDLHQGVPVKKLRQTFGALIKDVAPEEIAEMENALIREGFPPEEIQRLCDVHAEVFDRALKKVGKSSKVPGHPLYTFLQENKEAKRILKDLKRNLKPLAKERPAAEAVERFSRTLSLMKEIEKHYQRKEYQLFPLLESKGFSGPTKVMWGKHDEIRGHLKKLESLLRSGDRKELTGQFKVLSRAIKRMIFLEEKILYPTSARKLDARDWAKIKKGEPEIGYAWVKPSDLWDARLAESLKAPEEAREADASRAARDASTMESEAILRLSTGRLRAEQVDLMLKTLPFDITLVDENDRVAYYSDTRDRIFPRSPAIIGREVQNCHPPSSVSTVNEIIKAFREKRRSSAEFWLQKAGLFLLIRYYPLYDDRGEYRGVIEVSQDLSRLRTLEGEKRLLDWKTDGIPD